MSEKEQDEQSRGFKVEDRRRFSAEGELKPEHREEKPVPTDADKPSYLGQSGSNEPHQAATAGGRAGSKSAAEITFATFIVGLSTQVLLHLGEIPDPVTNQPHRDLPAAQHLIDILGMLGDKTKGNLDPDEEGMLKSILFDLRMKYVETARQHH